MNPSSSLARLQKSLDENPGGQTLAHMLLLAEWWCSRLNRRGRAFTEKAPELRGETTLDDSEHFIDISVRFVKGGSPPDNEIEVHFESKTNDPGGPPARLHNCGRIGEYRRRDYGACSRLPDRRGQLDDLRCC